MRRILACSVFFAILVSAELLPAQAFIESVFPPAVQRGQVNRVTLHGSKMFGASGLWLTLGDDAVHAQPISDSSETQVTVEIEVAPDAPLGLYGLRLATRDGLSNVHLFAVDELQPVVEEEAVEPRKRNNKRQQAQELTLPAAVFGTCTDADLDYFVFEAAAGETLAFEVVGSRLGKAFDPVATIYKENGEFVGEFDNDVGLFFDCRFEHTFKEAGRYFVRLRDTRFLGSEHWTYLLRIGHFPVARVALPSTAAPGEASLVNFPQAECGPREIAFPHSSTSERFFVGLRGDQHDAPAWLPLAVSPLTNTVEAEPNDLPEQATVAAVPGNLHGLMNRRGDGDCFALALKKGQRLEFRSDTRDSGSAADVQLTLLGPDGKSLKSVDDVGFEDAHFDFTVPADGRYTLQVSEVVRKHGPEYVYRIEVKERQPGVRLLSEIGRMAIPQGTWQPLLLKLERKDFGGEVQLELLGAPSGITLRESTIAAGSNDLTGAILVDGATPAGVYTLQIRATATHNDQQLTAFARTQPLVDRVPTGRGPHGEPFELREDQRRLPPSLTDRIAVVVLPRAPFDFRLTAPLVTLPRYTQATFPIETTRVAGFAAPISFAARGGQLEYNRLQMPSVKPEIPDASPDTSLVTAILRSGVNTKLAKQRVTVTGTAVHDGRTVHLTRTFELQVEVAFAVAAEPKKLELHPGDTAKVKLLANRRAPFDGQLTIAPSENEGLKVPKEVAIAAGQPDVEFDLAVAADTKPGSYKVKLPATTRIGKFFESSAGETLEIVVNEKKEEAAKEAGE